MMMTIDRKKSNNMKAKAFESYRLKIKFQIFCTIRFAKCWRRRRTTTAAAA
jgi:hypothetical protein